VRRRFSAISLAAIILVRLPADARAEDLASILTGYNIVSWGAAEGLSFGDVRAMAQDREGYLWLGTQSGLVRFDGVRFAPWSSFGAGSLPARPVLALHVSPDGSFWIGFGGQGGVARVRALPPVRTSGIRQYTEADGLAAGAITALVEDHRGTLWASALSGLYWFADDRWNRWTARGLPDGPIHTAHVDSRDRLFVSTVAGVFVLAAEREVFEQLEGTQRKGPISLRRDGPPDDWIGAISVDARGRVWLSDRLAGFTIADGSAGAMPPSESGRGRCLLRDRAGNVWVGTAGQGLWRVKESASDRLSVDRSTDLTGLLGNGVMSLFEDRDGHIWASTVDGLNRLVPRQATVLSGLVAGMELEGGAVWVATSHGAMRLDATGSATLHGRPSPDAAITAIHTDERGRLWLAARNRVSLIARGRKRELLLDDTDSIESIELVTSDRRGGVWMYDGSGAILRWNGKTIQSNAVAPQSVPKRLLWMDTQRNGTLWLLGRDGRVASVADDGSVRQYGPRDGLEGDLYRAMHEDRDGGVWLGGARGLTRFAYGRFRTLRRINGHPLQNITAVIEDESGSFWLGTNSGVVRFSPADFDRAVASSGERIPYRLYTSDTLASNPRWYGQRGGVRAPDGRLWFVTSRGVTVIDPRVAPAKQAPVPARIEGIVVDGQIIDPAAESRLPAGARRVEVSFSALALTNPERTHFRYRLEGFDPDWVEAGTRRQAAYTNLPAGQYRLHVMASGTDGTWPDSGALWVFSVAPTFYRTAWFAVICLSAFGVTVIGAWSLHLRQVRMRFALLLGERTRLSREIHDTLLQGLFGVALRCDAIASELETSAPRVRDYFAAMRRDVESYIQEARQSIWNLRSPKLDELGLPAALRDAGEHATAGLPVRFAFTISGAPKPCPRAVEEQLLRIGQEAVANALRHAHASEIRMELCYEEGGLVLRLTDNGFGFDVDRAGGNGRYGLINMKERADAAGGDVRIHSRSGQGTSVEARVPYGRVPIGAA
jgi:signal transduction histidine kinase/ligand-binding sensor domain-containing protein